MCVTVPNFFKIRRTVAYTVFQNGGRLSSWNCCVCIWTTDGEHLVVFSVEQNLAGIDAVASYACFSILRVRLDRQNRSTGDGAARSHV